MGKKDTAPPTPAATMSNVDETSSEAAQVPPDPLLIVAFWFGVCGLLGRERQGDPHRRVVHHWAVHGAGDLARARAGLRLDSGPESRVYACRRSSRNP